MVRFLRKQTGSWSEVFRKWTGSTMEPNYYPPIHEFVWPQSTFQQWKGVWKKIWEAYVVNHHVIIMSRGQCHVISVMWSMIMWPCLKVTWVNHMNSRFDTFYRAYKISTPLYYIEMYLEFTVRCPPEWWYEEVLCPPMLTHINES